MPTNEKQPWYPEGAFDVPMIFRLSESQAQSVLSATGQQSHPRAAEFINRINEIINQHRGHKWFEEQGKPSQVKRDLKALVKDAGRLSSRLRNMHSTTHILLSREGRAPHYKRVIAKEMPDGSLNVGDYFEVRPGFTADETEIAVLQLEEMARAVIFRIDRDYDIAKRPADRPRRALAMDTACALRDILALSPSTTDDGVFSNVLRLVMGFAGIVPRKKKGAGSKTSGGARAEIRADLDVRTLVRLAVDQLAADPKLQSDNPP